MADTDTDTRTPAEQIKAVMDALGLTVSAVFVPWSKSRSFKPGAKLADRNLNWKITIRRGQFDVLTTDYSAGLAHCPAYDNSKAYGFGLSVAKAEALSYETEHGKTFTPTFSIQKAKPIQPDPVSVVWCLVQDAGVIDAGGFESWASDLGYDTDSRKAEATYRECLDIALKLRAALGDEGLKQLQTAGEGY